MTSGIMQQRASDCNSTFTRHMALAICTQIDVGGLTRIEQESSGLSTSRSHNGHRMNSKGSAHNTISDYAMSRTPASRSLYFRGCAIQYTAPKALDKPDPILRTHAFPPPPSSSPAQCRSCPCNYASLPSRSPRRYLDFGHHSNRTSNFSYASHNV